MTNKIAFYLGLLITGAIVFDIAVYEGANLIFLARKMLDLMEWIAFWR